MLNIRSFDTRRDLAVAQTSDEAVLFATAHWVEMARESIASRGKFAVALSGGSTPNAIYRELGSSYRDKLDWSKVWLFWGDERAVPPEHPDNNYSTAMKAGLSELPIPPNHIFRMRAEASDKESSAHDYQALIERHVPHAQLDLVMLGVGEDGHTASLFPSSKALHVQDKLVVPNWVEEKQCWRMTITFPCIEKSKLAVVYAIGINKQGIVRQVLHAEMSSPFPASRIGSEKHKALWILDQAAAALV